MAKIEEDGAHNKKKKRISGKGMSQLYMIELVWAGRRYRQRSSPLKKRNQTLSNHPPPLTVRDNYQITTAAANKNTTTEEDVRKLLPATPWTRA